MKNGMPETIPGDLAKRVASWSSSMKQKDKHKKMRQKEKEIPPTTKPP